MNRIWESQIKDDRRNQKLKVDFIYPNSSGQLETVLEGPETESPITTNIDKLRSNYNIESITGSDYGTAERYSSAPGTDPFAELQSLRKKYDAIVEYTVHLTAERDYHFTQAEEKRKNENRDKSGQKKNVDTTPKAKGADKAINKKNNASSGYSIFIVIFVAFVAFMVGRWAASTPARP